MNKFDNIPIDLKSKFVSHRIKRMSKSHLLNTPNAEGFKVAIKRVNSKKPEKKSKLVDINQWLDKYGHILANVYKTEQEKKRGDSFYNHDPKAFNNDVNDRLKQLKRYYVGLLHFKL